MFREKKFTSMEDEYRNSASSITRCFINFVQQRDIIICVIIVFIPIRGSLPPGPLAFILLHLSGGYRSLPSPEEVRSWTLLCKVVNIVVDDVNRLTDFYTYLLYIYIYIKTVKVSNCFASCTSPSGITVQ